VTSSKAAGFESEDDGQADESFLADESNFNALSVGLHGQNRGHSVVQEISRTDSFAHLVQNLAELQTHKFERGVNLRTFLTRKTAQNRIGDPAPVNFIWARLLGSLYAVPCSHFDH
jgi:hypothetical protein